MKECDRCFGAGKIIAYPNFLNPQLLEVCGKCKGTGTIEDKAEAEEKFNINLNSILGECDRTINFDLKEKSK